MSNLNPPQNFISGGCLYEQIEVGGSFEKRLHTFDNAWRQWQKLVKLGCTSEYIVIWCKSYYPRMRCVKFSYGPFNTVKHMNAFGLQSIKRTCPYAIYRKLL